MPTLEIATLAVPASALEVQIDQQEVEKFLAWFRGAKPGSVFTFDTAGVMALVQKSTIAIVKVLP